MISCYVNRPLYFYLTQHKDMEVEATKPLNPQRRTSTLWFNKQGETFFWLHICFHSSNHHMMDSTSCEA